MARVVYSSVYVGAAIGEKEEQGSRAGLDTSLAHVSLNKSYLSRSTVISFCTNQEGEDS